MQFPPTTNFGYSNVATAPSPANSGTTFSCDVGEGGRFPDPATEGQYELVFWPATMQPLVTNAEIAVVTARSGDNFTIIRGQGGTSAKAITTDYQIAMTITADRQDLLPQSNWHKVEQTAHGLSVLNPVYFDGTDWLKAQANASTTLATHIVAEVIDVDNFVLVGIGRFSSTAHGLTLGSTYYLSSSVAGGLTVTPPSTYIQPLIYVESADVLHFIPTRGDVLTLTGTQTTTNKTLTTPKINENVNLTATSTELNILDGATLSTAELNTLDGLTASTSELNILDGAMLDVNELNKLNGLTSSTAELNILDGVTADAAELNILDGVTANATEINLLDNQTSTTLHSSAAYLKALINGGFDIWQRNTSFTPNTTAYTADRWKFLTETNASWTIARSTDVPTSEGFSYSMQATKQATGANAQMALVQLIEGVNAKKFKGRKASLSLWAKTNGTEIGALRAAILSWNSTENSLTAAVISSWAQDGTNPTFAANYTMENTPSNLSLTSSWQRFTIENVDIDTSGMTNLAVIIWVDDGTISTNDDFFLTGIQLNEGAVALPWIPRMAQEELILCSRYFQQAGSGFLGKWYSSSAAQIGGGWRTIMRTTPSVSLNTTTPTIDEIGVAARTGSSSAIAANVFTTEYSGAYNIDGFSGAGVNAVALGRTNMFNADAEL